MKGLGRALAGESLFMNIYTADKDDVEIDDPDLEEDMDDSDIEDSDEEES